MHEEISYQPWEPKELAQQLGIGASTLRKWSLELEKAGYEFQRDKHGRRFYLERDGMALVKLKQLLDSGSSYEDATKAITESFPDDSEPISLPAKLKIPDNDARYEELNEKMDVLINLTREMFQRMDEKDRTILRLTENVERLEQQKALEQPQQHRMEARIVQVQNEVKQIKKVSEETAAAVQKKEQPRWAWTDQMKRLIRRKD